MADYDWAPAVTEVAKAVQSGTDLVKSFGGYAGAIARGPIESVVDIIGDRLRYARGIQAINLYRRTLQRLEDAGLDTSSLRPPTPAIEMPLLAAATDEDREELIALWDKLLAAAIAPSSREKVRLRHIEILKSLEPLDAQLLARFSELYYEAGRLPQQVSTPAGITMRSGEQNFREHAAEVFGVDVDEIAVSIDNLTSLGLCMTGNTSMGYAPQITALARNFLAVFNEPLK